MRLNSQASKNQFIKVMMQLSDRVVRKNGSE